MKITSISNSHRGARRGVSAAALLALAFSLPVTAQSLATSSLDGGGVSSSPDFTLISSFQATAGRPSTSGPIDGYGLNLYPGFLSGQTAPDPTATPVIHLVPSGPGLLALLAVPDVPGWQWSHSVDLQSWFLLPSAQDNPTIVETTLEREFFRLEQP